MDDVATLRAHFIDASVQDLPRVIWKHRRRLLCMALRQRRGTRAVRASAMARG